MVGTVVAVISRVSSSLLLLLRLALLGAFIGAVVAVRLAAMPVAVAAAAAALAGTLLQQVERAGLEVGKSGHTGARCGSQAGEAHEGSCSSAEEGRRGMSCQPSRKGGQDASRAKAGR